MIKAALLAYGKAQKKGWSHDRQQTVGASEIGSCARRIAFSKAACDPTAEVSVDLDHEDTWGAATRGSVYEDAFFVPALRARFGANLLFSGPEQRTFVSDFLSATPDGIIVDLKDDDLLELGIESPASDCVIVDCKTIDPRVRLCEPKPEHIYQVIVGMGVIRETTNFRPDYAILTYTDASFWDYIQEFVIKFDSDVYLNAKDRARQIMTAAQGSDLRPEGIIAGRKECHFCPYTTQCGMSRADRVPDDITLVHHEVKEKITELALAAKSKEELSKQLSIESGQIKQDIRDLLEKAGTRSIPGVVSWSALKGAETWDDKGIRAAAEAAGLDLTPFRKKGDPGDRLTIGLKSITKAQSA